MYIKRLVKNGVRFVTKKIGDQESFLKENTEYDIVFNCLGIGAKEFCNDKLIVPIRGQMIRVYWYYLVLGAGIGSIFGVD